MLRRSDEVAADDGGVRTSKTSATSSGEVLQGHVASEELRGQRRTRAQAVEVARALVEHVRLAADVEKRGRVGETRGRVCVDRVEATRSLTAASMHVRARTSLTIA